ncbi:unnamed protein product [Camellia sinensis]
MSAVLATCFFVRRGRWREGDKELGDSRKVDRWADNSSARNFGETRRTVPERWTDLSNKETNYKQRRESKWNTRWGPDNKETDSLRDKRIDSNRDADMPLDKGLSQLTQHAKDEKEGDHYRPWRPNSHNRGRAEPSHHSTPSKQGSTFLHSRGRGDNALQTLSPGRERVGLPGLFSPGFGRSHCGESGIGLSDPCTYLEIWTLRESISDLAAMDDRREKEELQREKETPIWLRIFC